MSQTYNIYCDESCHLEHDHQKVMVLGAIWCPEEKSRQIAVHIREIKSKHGLNPYKFEIKWTKVSPAKASFYLEIMDYFFDSDDLHFRALVVPDKSKLEHDRFNQDHDKFYYKMYFDMLKTILKPDDRYRIYIDYKDTQGGQKVAKLHDVLCSSLYDFSQEIIERIQIVNSHEVEIIQMTDLLIGTIAYANRDISGNEGKVLLVKEMRKRSRYTLKLTTLLQEQKVNLLIWRPKEEEYDLEA